MRERARPVVAGVDGCRAGWIVVSRVGENAHPESRVLAGASELVALATGLAVLAVDIPIGLTDRGRRACDEAARALLGWPRRNSVFPAPVRSALRATSRVEASEATQRADGRRVAAQAWGIYPKVRDIDLALRKGTPATRRKIHEVHPELSFRAWNADRSIVASKKSTEGKGLRRRLVNGYFGKGAYEKVRESYLKKNVADDDILDAFAALWSAERILRRDAVSLPARPPKDRFGIPMRIVY